ncbi:hypothetical protein [Rhodoferax sp.]|uniref:hypothetical protein n=1 Tax=Rhodoferax sp. TaxID=50421 RepID=UPI002774F0D4|nr:hypothetical protein [Rhodoferax sp.]
MIEPNFTHLGRRSTLVFMKALRGVVAQFGSSRAQAVAKNRVAHASVQDALGTSA